MSLDVQRILVPVDFSKHADQVVEWAAELAVEHHSALTLLHAYHVPIELQHFEGAYLPADYWRCIKNDATSQLDHYAEIARRRGIEVESLVREGYPATVIEEEALRVHADLIVIGSQGRSMLKHLLVGSIAERVVHKAHCPVLTVKPTTTH